MGRWRWSQKTTIILRKKPRFSLHAMPVNHYGEKVRWILDLLQAPYEEFDTAGILSVFFRGRSLPYLTDRETCCFLGNSDECLMYLSAVYVPTIAEVTRREKVAEMLRRNAQTMKWEVTLNKLGHLIQGWAYYPLLGAKTKRVYLLAWGAYEPMVPWTHRWFLRA